jgi:O-antigen ligase
MIAFFFISRIGSPNWGMKQLQEVFLSSGGGVPTKSAAGRIDMWKRGLELFSASPIEGAGIGAIRIYTKYPNAHSVYFSILFELGLVGMSLFLIAAGLFLEGLYSAVKICEDRQLSVFLYAFLSVLIATAFESLIHFELAQELIWLILGIGAALISIVSKQVKESPHLPGCDEKGREGKDDFLLQSA